MNLRHRIPVIVCLSALACAAIAGPVLAQSPMTPSALPSESADDGGVVAGRYDIGGRSLFMTCVGPAESTLPTVIAEAGLGESSDAFRDLFPLLVAQPFRSCAYDRAGMGDSSLPADGPTGGHGPVTLANGVDDLHALLDVAGIAPPYVLVAHSLGGWYAREFASMHPAEVAGVVFVDSSHPDQVARLAAVLPPAHKGEDFHIVIARDSLATGWSDAPTSDNGWLDLPTSVAQVAATGDLGDLPVVVLTHGEPIWDLPEPYSSREEVAWLGLQNELASLSTRGVQRTVPGAGHFIQQDAPEAVARAILDTQAVIAGGPSATFGDR